MGFTDSLFGALGLSSKASREESRGKIRDAMLNALGRYDTTPYQSLFMSIYSASTVEALSGHVPELHRALTELHGAAEADARMHSIEALLPEHQSLARRLGFDE